MKLCRIFTFVFILIIGFSITGCDNDAAGNLRNIINADKNVKGHAAYSTISGWRNATAGPAMNSDVYGFWPNEAD